MVGEEIVPAAGEDVGRIAEADGDGGPRGWDDDVNFV